MRVNIKKVLSDLELAAPENPLAAQAVEAINSLREDLQVATQDIEELKENENTVRATLNAKRLKTMIEQLRDEVRLIRDANKEENYHRLLRLEQENEMLLKTMKLREKYENTTARGSVRRMALREIKELE